MKSKLDCMTSQMNTAKKFSKKLHKRVQQLQLLTFMVNLKVKLTCLNVKSWKLSSSICNLFQNVVFCFLKTIKSPLFSKMWRLMILDSLFINVHFYQKVNKSSFKASLRIQLNLIKVLLRMKIHAHWNLKKVRFNTEKIWSKSSLKQMI